MVELASAQARIVPIVRMANREYGVSGSYLKQKDANSRNISDLTVLGHWGLISNWGLQVEVESGYGRHTVDVRDSTAQDFSVAGNVLMNYSLFDHFSIFGLIGYGYMRNWEERTLGKVTTTTKSGRRFFQYGGGVKWLLVPNVALRADYRFQMEPRVKNADPNKDRQFVLLGISVFQ